MNTVTYLNKILRYYIYYYKVFQMFLRLATEGMHEDAQSLLLAGAKLLLQHNQVDSGGELAITLAQHLTTYGVTPSGNIARYFTQYTIQYTIYILYKVLLQGILHSIQYSIQYTYYTRCYCKIHYTEYTRQGTIARHTTLYYTIYSTLYICSTLYSMQ